jgi:serine/threonine protein kinase
MYLYSTKLIYWRIGEIIKALRYLEEKKIIHRDIAARNILVDQAERVMISDLGMSRTEDYYATSETKMPIRWCAPESLKVLFFFIQVI